MSGPIFTKLHAALELIQDDEAENIRGDRQPVRELLEAMAEAPLYVLDYELSLQLDQRALASSITAIYEAGRLRLPFPRMCFELWSNWARTPKRDTASPGHEKYAVHRLFVLTDEIAPGVYDLSILEYREADSGNGISMIMRCRMTWVASAPDDQTPIFPPLKPGEDASKLSGFSVRYGPELEGLVPVPGLLNKIFHELCIGLSMGIMLVNISGIEREKVQPKASFNRARERSGKPKIPDHTVVRIGHVYNSSGQRVAYDRGATGRQPMRVHMRAAHTRRQQHGPAFLDTDEGRQYRGLSSTTETHHVVLIDAVLVNYRDGTDLERPLPKVVKF